MGDGRHRADPKGHGHYLAATLGIFLLVALLAGGSYTLHGALTTGPSTPPTPASSEGQLPSPANSVIAAATPNSSERASRNDSPPTLKVQAVDGNCYLEVTTPAGDVLIAEELSQGERFISDKPELEVTVGNPAAVDVYVNGTLRESGEGVETFEVNRED